LQVLLRRSTYMKYASLLRACAPCQFHTFGGLFTKPSVFKMTI